MLSKRLKAVAMAVIVLAPVSLIAAGSAYAAGSKYCPANRACIYEHANFQGILDDLPPNSSYKIDYNNFWKNDRMSSWENKTGTHGHWTYEKAFRGTCRTMAAKDWSSYVGLDNDKLTSWATTGSCANRKIR